MSPPVDPVESDPSLPARVDVVVIGGGIIGVSTVLALAEKGISAALCEKGRIGGEQSSRNWGWCRTMGRDPREIPLSIEAQRIWRGLDRRLGIDTGYRQSGIVYLCETSKEAAKHEAWLAHARSYQIDSRLIGPDEIERLLPGSSRRWPAALYTPSDGCAEPEKATSAIANAAFGKGASILERCAVRGIETTAGAVSGVVTESGPIRCNRVVLASGAWAGATEWLPELTVRALVKDHNTASVRTAESAGLARTGEQVVLPDDLPDEPEQIAGSLAEFVVAVRARAAGESVIPNGEVHANVLSVAMVEAAVRSAETGQRVALATVVEDAYEQALAAERDAGVRAVLASWSSVLDVVGLVSAGQGTAAPQVLTVTGEVR